MDQLPTNTTQFFDHVFNEKTKSEMLNIIQYSLISIVPVVFLNKTMAYYIPEADEYKDSIEVLLEIIIQVMGMFVGMLIIHRMVTYIPPSSGMNYPEFHVTHVILSVLLIILSLQTKIGEKVSILTRRFLIFINGREGFYQPQQQQIPRSIQPLANQPQQQPLQQQQPQTTPLHQLPDHSQQQQQQQQPMKYSSAIPQPDINGMIAPYSAGDDKFGQW